MAQSWIFYLMLVILHPQNSPVDFAGLFGLPMKVKFMVSLMFLLYGPKHHADLPGGSVLLGAELFSLCFSLRIPASLPQLSQAHEATLMECTKHFQTVSVRDRHLSYFTHSASWNPCLDLHPGKLLNLWRPNFPPFWSPIPVFCPVHENWNTTVVRFCQPLCCWWPGNKPTSKCPDQALVHSRLALPCTSPCWEPWTSLDLAPLSKELKY